MMMNHLRAVGIRQETVNSLDTELTALRTSETTPLLALMRYAKLGQVRVTVIEALSGSHVCDLEMHLVKTVGELKDEIEKHTGFPAWLQQLIPAKGLEPMRSHDTLAGCGVTTLQSIIQVGRVFPSMMFVIGGRRCGEIWGTGISCAEVLDTEAGN